MTSTDVGATRGATAEMNDDACLTKRLAILPLFLSTNVPYHRGFRQTFQDLPVALSQLSGAESLKTSRFSSPFANF